MAKPTKAARPVLSAPAWMVSPYVKQFFWKALGSFRTQWSHRRQNQFGIAWTDANYETNPTSILFSTKWYEGGEKSDDELAIPAQPAGNKRHAFAVAKHVTE